MPRQPRLQRRRILELGKENDERVIDARKRFIEMAARFLVDDQRAAAALPDHELRAVGRIGTVEGNISVPPEERRDDPRVRRERSHRKNGREGRPVGNRRAVESGGVGRGDCQKFSVRVRLFFDHERRPVREFPGRSQDAGDQGPIPGIHGNHLIIWRHMVLPYLRVASHCTAVKPISRARRLCNRCFGREESDTIGRLRERESAKKGAAARGAPFGTARITGSRSSTRATRSDCWATLHPCR